MADLTHKISRRQRAKESFDTLTGGLSENGLIENAETCFEELYDFMSDDDAEEAKRSFENLYAVIKNISNDFYDEEGDLNSREEIENRLGALRIKTTLQYS